jgi:hypothetical protein
LRQQLRRPSPVEENKTPTQSLDEIMAQETGNDMEDAVMGAICEEKVNPEAGLALGNRGKVKRRVRACPPPPPKEFAPPAQNLPHFFSSQPLFLPLFSHIGVRQ